MVVFYFYRFQTARKIISRILNPDHVTSHTRVSNRSKDTLFLTVNSQFEFVAVRFVNHVHHKMINSHSPNVPCFFSELGQKYVMRGRGDSAFDSDLIHGVPGNDRLVRTITPCTCLFFPTTVTAVTA